nr:hypothetical protein [Thermaerobacter subterraneus]
MGRTIIVGIEENEYTSMATHTASGQQGCLVQPGRTGMKVAALHTNRREDFQVVHLQVVGNAA